MNKECASKREGVSVVRARAREHESKRAREQESKKGEKTSEKGRAREWRAVVVGNGQAQKRSVCARGQGGERG